MADQYLCKKTTWHSGTQKLYEEGQKYPFAKDPGKYFVKVGPFERNKSAEVLELEKLIEQKDKKIKELEEQLDEALGQLSDLTGGKVIPDVDPKPKEQKGPAPKE